MKDTTTIIELLQKYKLLNNHIKNIDWHLGLLYQRASYIRKKLNKNDLDEKDFANYILEIFEICNPSSKNYDKKIDENIIRICLDSKNHLRPRRKNPNYGDDNDEKYSDIMDSLIDIENDKSY